MGDQLVRSEVEGGLGRLIIDMPPMNVLTIPAIEAGIAALKVLQSDQAVKVIAVEAAGDKAFSAGVDVADHTPEKMDHMLASFEELCLGLHRSPKPTVALVRRMALGGGCEVAMCCDMIVASDQATFGQPEVKVGVYPIIGVALFSAMMGAKAANELLLSGAIYSAEDSLRMGMVNRVFPDASFEDDVAKYLNGLLKNSGLVMSFTKKAVLAGLGTDTDTALQEATRIYVKELMVTEDANEGLRAFIEKRKPVWKEA
jgi:cyclohexa-1,5-dienecarbonyl-CoA hydratase